jgi:transglutaminase-like putative cysteine protease
MTLRLHAFPPQALRCILIALLAMLCQSVQAQSDDAAHVRIRRINISTDVAADWRAQTETLIERQALSEHGSVLASKYVVAYDKELETLEMVEAYTLKPDGRKIPARSERLGTQGAMADPEVRAGWPGSELLQVSFADVHQQDRTVVRMVQTTLALPLEGWFSIYDFLSPDYAYDDYRFRLSAPVGFELRTVGAALASHQEEVNGRQVWSIQGASAVVPVDEQAIDQLAVWPHIVGSSLQSHAQLVQAYVQKNRLQAEVTPDALKLAQRLTWGLQLPQAKAQAIYEWVRDNIRYVDIGLGSSGWQAHGADWILARRLGDSKDHALLMQVLLKAVDVQAVPALINTAGQYRLPELPSRHSFNHVIVYVPEFNLFADSTSTASAWGELPWLEQDRPVAVALAEGARILQTPAGTPEQNTLVSRSRWKIDANGNATLDLQVDATGYSALELQDRLQFQGSQAGNQLVRHIVQDSGFKGTGKLQKARASGASLPFSLALQLDLRGVLADKGLGVVNPNPPLAALPVYVRSQNHSSAAMRTYAQRCLPVSVREEFEVQFSPAFALSRVPDPAELHNEDGVRFTAEYRLEGNTLKGVRTLVLSQPRHVCTPQDYARRKPTFDQITRLLKSTLLYQQ